MNEVAKSPGAALKTQMQSMAADFIAALPPHIPAERFQRVVLTAVNENPELMQADRRSLLSACLRAAQDGLMPDGRDGALVVYKTKVGDRWVPRVQFMPMMGGLLKKARNSGEIKSVEAHVVREGDRFRYVLGDNPSLEHEPDLDNVDEPGALRFAYAIAWLKNGTVIREVMTRSQVAQVRNVSKSKDSPSGPWAKWEDEMWRKAVFRRLSKWLPKSSDLDDLLRRDDENYDLSGDKAELAASRAAQIGMFRPVANPLADEAPEPPALAYSDDGLVDPETGEVEEIRQEPGGAPLVEATAERSEDTGGGETRTSGALRKAAEPTKETLAKARDRAAASSVLSAEFNAAPDPAPTDIELKAARKSGADAFGLGVPRSAVPKDYKNRSLLRQEWLIGWDRGTEGNGRGERERP